MHEKLSLNPREQGKDRDRFKKVLPKLGKSAGPNYDTVARQEYRIQHRARLNRRIIELCYCYTAVRLAKYGYITAVGNPGRPTR